MDIDEGATSGKRIEEAMHSLAAHDLLSGHVVFAADVRCNSELEDLNAPQDENHNTPMNISDLELMRALLHEQRAPVAT